MQKLISPQNNIIVKIKNKYIDTITYKSGVTLYRDTTYHPEESAAMWGTEAIPPRSIIRRADYEGYSQLPVEGDTLLMRYDVVFSYKDQPERDTPIYDNLILHDSNEYWKCDIMKAFAVKTANGLSMLNGYVMCDAIEEERAVSQLLILPEHMRSEVRKDKFRIRYINNGPAVPGEVIYCKPNVAQQYWIDEDQFYIIKQSHILGIAEC